MTGKSLHSICRWTFNPGKGGFVPGDMRPEWGGAFGSPDMIKLVADKIVPRLPDDITLGIELHYDAEVDDDNAAAVADALVDNKLYLAMITPGAHCHFGYGGVVSLDPPERKAAEELGTKTVDLAYGTLKKAWHTDTPPSLVVWNGSFGCDIASVDMEQMYQNLEESIAKFCKYEKKKGVNNEFAHSEMSGLGHVADSTKIPKMQSRLTHRDEEYRGCIRRRISGAVSQEGMRILAACECFAVVGVRGAFPWFNFDTLSLGFALGGIFILLIPRDVGKLVNKLAHYLRNKATLRVNRITESGVTIELGAKNARVSRKKCKRKP